MQNHDDLIGVIMILAALAWLGIAVRGHMKRSSHE